MKLCGQVRDNKYILTEGQHGVFVPSSQAPGSDIVLFDSWSPDLISDPMTPAQQENPRCLHSGSQMLNGH